MGKKPSKEREAIRDICRIANKKKSNHIGDELTFATLYLKVAKEKIIFTAELKSHWYFDWIENTKLLEVTNLLLKNAIRDVEKMKCSKQWIETLMDTLIYLYYSKELLKHFYKFPLDPYLFCLREQNKSGRLPLLAMKLIHSCVQPSEKGRAIWSHLYEGGIFHKLSAVFLLHADFHEDNGDQQFRISSEIVLLILDIWLRVLYYPVSVVSSPVLRYNIENIRRQQHHIFTLLTTPIVSIELRAHLLLKETILRSNVEQCRSIQTSAILNGILIWEIRKFLTLNDVSHPQPVWHTDYPRVELKQREITIMTTIELICMQHSLGLQAFRRMLPLAMVERRWFSVGRVEIKRRYDTEEMSSLLRFPRSERSPNNAEDREPTIRRKWFQLNHNSSATIGIKGSSWQEGPPCSVLEGQNWVEVLSSIHLDIENPILIWNDIFRTELLDSVNTEAAKNQYLREKGELNMWHPTEFEVIYRCQERRLKVNGFYVDQLLIRLKHGDFQLSDSRTLIARIADRCVVEPPTGNENLIKLLELMFWIVKHYCQDVMLIVPFRYLLSLLDDESIEINYWSLRILHILLHNLRLDPSCRELVSEIVSAGAVERIVPWVLEKATPRCCFISPDVSKHTFHCLHPVDLTDTNGIDSSEPTYLTSQGEGLPSASSKWDGEESPESPVSSILKTEGVQEWSQKCVSSESFHTALCTAMYLVKLSAAATKRLGARSAFIEGLVNRLEDVSIQSSCHFPVFVTLLRQIAKVVPTTLTMLREQGLTRILLKACIDKESGEGCMTDNIASTLRILDSTNEQGYLPPTLRRFLSADYPVGEFVKIFNGEEQSPKIIWGGTERSQCLSMLERSNGEGIDIVYSRINQHPRCCGVNLVPLLDNVAEDALSPIDSERLYRALYSNLQYTLEESETSEDLSDSPIDEGLSILSSTDRLGCIYQALRYLLHKNGELWASEVLNTTRYATLMRKCLWSITLCLKSIKAQHTTALDASGPLAVIIDFITFTTVQESESKLKKDVRTEVDWYCIARDTEGVESRANVFLMEGGLWRISSLLQHYIPTLNLTMGNSPSDQSDSVYLPVQFSFRFIVHLCRMLHNNSNDKFMDQLKANNSIIAYALRCIQTDYLKSFPSVSSNAIMIILMAARNPVLVQYLRDCGAIISLLSTMWFAPLGKSAFLHLSEKDQSSTTFQRNHQYLENGTNMIECPLFWKSHKQSEITTGIRFPNRVDVVITAAEILRVMCKSDDSGSVKTATEQILTPGLFHLIMRGDLIRFLKIFKSDKQIHQARIFWTDEIREVFESICETETDKIMKAANDGRWPLWRVEDFVANDGYLHQYPILYNQVIVKGVFCRALVSTPKSVAIDLDPLSLTDFKDALEKSIAAKEQMIADLQIVAEYDDLAQKRYSTLSEFMAVEEEAMTRLLLEHPGLDFKS